ncbi:hypothetical protein N9S81_00165 [bacterium]|nr:hypothetical protein [bacterium]
MLNLPNPVVEDISAKLLDLSNYTNLLILSDVEFLSSLASAYGLSDEIEDLIFFLHDLYGVNYRSSIKDLVSHGRVLDAYERDSPAGQRNQLGDFEFEQGQQRVEEYKNMYNGSTRLTNIAVLRANVQDVTTELADQVAFPVVVTAAFLAPAVEPPFLEAPESPDVSMSDDLDAPVQQVQQVQPPELPDLSDLVESAESAESGVLASRAQVRARADNLILDVGNDAVVATLASWPTYYHDSLEASLRVTVLRIFRSVDAYVKGNSSAFQAVWGAGGSVPSIASQDLVRYNIQALRIAMSRVFMAIDSFHYPYGNDEQVRDSIVSILKVVESSWTFALSTASATPREQIVTLSLRLSMRIVAQHALVCLYNEAFLR